VAQKALFFAHFDVFLRAYSRLWVHRIAGAPSKLRLAIAGGKEARLFLNAKSTVLDCSDSDDSDSLP
jgi:hypothetical protein